MPDKHFGEICSSAVRRHTFNIYKKDGTQPQQQQQQQQQVQRNLPYYTSITIKTVIFDDLIVRFFGQTYDFWWHLICHAKNIEKFIENFDEKGIHRSQAEATPTIRLLQYYCIMVPRM